MKNDLNDLKNLTLKLLQGDSSTKIQEENSSLIRKIYGHIPQQMEHEPQEHTVTIIPSENASGSVFSRPEEPYSFAQEIPEEDEGISLKDKEIELIQKALERHAGKRKEAAKDLGISERTLYRKIKQYDIE